MKANKILIVVDMQRDFIDMALGTKEAQTIVDNVAAKVAEARAKGDKIIFTRDTHFDDYMETEEGRNIPVPHCIKGTVGWQIDERVGAAETDEIIDKVTFGAADLGLVLKEHLLIGEIELAGLCTDICVLSNAVLAKAAVPNVPLIVDAACCAGVTPKSHDTALEAMKAVQVKIINQGQEPWR